MGSTKQIWFVKLKTTKTAMAVLVVNRIQNACNYSLTHASFKLNDFFIFAAYAFASALLLKPATFKR